MAWGFGKKSEAAEEAAKSVPELPGVTSPLVPKETDEYVVMPKALRVGIAAVKGRKPLPDDKVLGAPMSEVFPITAAVIKEEHIKEAARLKAEAAEREAMKNLQIGKLIAGKGIFIGQEERDGHKYNWFAAATDLTETSGKKILRTYNDTAKELASRGKWQGHDCADCTNETALYEGLGNGSLLGKWIIPPRHIVQGKDVDGNVVRKDNNLYALRDTGDFKGTFTTASGSGGALWYWSCTEHRKLPDYVYSVDFTDGAGDWGPKGLCSLSCRPCRVELVI